MHESEHNNRSQQLEELYEMVEENNDMLRSMTRSGRMRSIGKVLRGVIMLAIFIALVVFIRPYFQNAKKIYETVTTQIQQVQDTAQSINDKTDGVQNFFNNISEEVGNVDVGGFFGDIGIGENDSSAE